MNNSILVKMWRSDDLIAITTVDRAHGKHGRFLIIADRFEEWLKNPDGSHFMDIDCGDVLEICRDSARKEYCFKLMWLNTYDNDNVRGIQQLFSIPEDKIWDGVRTNLTHLYAKVAGHVKIEVFPGAAVIIRDICKNNVWKRAFCKAMRDNFHYGYGVLELFKDCGMDFGFFHDRLRGGLVIHTTDIEGKDGKTYPKTYYSVHT